MNHHFTKPFFNYYQPLSTILLTIIQPTINHQWIIQPDYWPSMNHHFTINELFLTIVIDYYQLLLNHYSTIIISPLTNHHLTITTIPHRTSRWMWPICTCQRSSDAAKISRAAKPTHRFRGPEGWNGSGMEVEWNDWLEVFIVFFL